MNINEICLKDYPCKMNQLRKIPKVIYYRGNIQLLNSKCVAVIGRRDAKEADISNAYRMGKFMAEHGYTVVNGVARGCDQAAIRGVLSYGGKAIIVMPCGVDVIYPSSAKKIIEEVLDCGGCLISQYSIGTSPEKYKFIERDWLQVAISDKVIVISANENGGSIETAKYAVKLGKPLAYICVSNTEMKKNSIWGERYNAIKIHTMKDVVDFMQEKTYEQLTLFEN